MVSTVFPKIFAIFKLIIEVKKALPFVYNFVLDKGLFYMLYFLCSWRISYGFERVNPEWSGGTKPRVLKAEKIQFKNKTAGLPNTDEESQYLTIRFYLLAY